MQNSGSDLAQMPPATPLTPSPCLRSRPRLHPERHPRTRAAGVRHPPAREPALPAEEQGLPASPRGRRLAGARYHAAAVRCEAWAWGVSLHRPHALWGGPAWLCPTLQGLPEDIQGRRGEGPEPLRDGHGVTVGDPAAATVCARIGGSLVLKPWRHMPRGPGQGLPDWWEMLYNAN